MTSPTLYADILRHAQKRPTAIAAYDSERAIRYADFAADIDIVSRRLASLHLVPDGLAAICLQQPYLHWVVLIALWRHGIMSITANIPAVVQSLPHFGTRVIFADNDDVPDFDARRINVDASWLQTDDSLPAFNEPVLAPVHGLRLVLSSGTTGTAKQVILTRAVLDARLDRVRRNPRFDTSIVFRSLVSVASVEFLFAVGAWAAGGAVDFSTEPLQDALAKGSLKANLVFMNTAQLCKLVNALPADAKPHRSLIVLAGGSIVPKEVSRKAHQRLAGMLMILYGSTEAGIVAINPNPLEYADPGVCGFVVPDMKVELINEAGHPVGAGATGEVRIHSTSCISAFKDDADGTRDCFKDGWFYPGDLGKMSSNGVLSIVGRKDEMINIGGAKIAPATIEHALLACPGVKEVAAFTVPDADGVERLWAAVVKDEGYAQDALEAAWARFDVAAWGRLNLIYFDAIPRNGMGKTMRPELVAAVKSHTPAKEALSTVNLNGEDIDVNRVSEAARATMASLRLIDTELQRLNQQKAACNEALDRMLADGSFLKQ